MDALTPDKLQTLAYEIALEYHPPEDLAARYGVPLALLTQLATVDNFQSMVLKARREIDESGDQLRMLARKLAGTLLPEMASLARDTTARHADRVAAFKCLADVGDLNKATPAGNANNFAIQINLG